MLCMFDFFAFTGHQHLLAYKGNAVQFCLLVSTGHQQLLVYMGKAVQICLLWVYRTPTYVNMHWEVLCMVDFFEFTGHKHVLVYKVNAVLFCLLFV